MPRNPDSPVTGSVADPDFRRRRAQHARRAQTTLDHAVRRIVGRADELTRAQRRELAAALEHHGEATAK